LYNIEDPASRLAAIQRAAHSRGIPLAREVLCDLAMPAGDMVPPAYSCLGACLQERTTWPGSLPTDQ